VHLLADALAGPDLARQIAIATACGVAIGEGLPAAPGEPVVIVDAMLGTGAAGRCAASLLAAVELGQRGQRDAGRGRCPDRVDADSGAVAGPVARADHTVTFQRSKPGLHVTPGRQFAGEVTVADIGLSEAPGDFEPVLLISPTAARAWLAGLRPGAHKGERGHLGIVGGSAGTPGAAVLAGASALRAGAGLVTIASGRSSRCRRS
jgi:hypothetical protein